jgi:RNA polymerase sigma-70 factor, ECF subfamily
MTGARAELAGAGNPMTGEPVERCLEELHPTSAGWALSCCRWDREEAEEVLQMTYLKILDGRARFDGRSSFKTWLFGVIRRTAAERRRGRWLRSMAGLRWRDGQPSPLPSPTPESLLGASETSRSLRAALQTLPARQREVLHLVFYQDLTVEEAARVLGISLGSARPHYHRGKAGLQERLGREVKP